MQPWTWAGLVLLLLLAVVALVLVLGPALIGRTLLGVGAL